MKKENVIIELIGVNKEYGSFTAVENFNLYVNKGEFVTFLGPSGCGKTTTLRMIAGFEIPTKGQILLNGEDITSLPPYKRPVNTVFQRYALFPHLDVYDNIAFGLKLKKVQRVVKDRHGHEKTKWVHLTQKEIDEKVVRALRIVDLEQFESRDITTLSGGQQQRVWIAMALAQKTPYLLLDEPTTYLDIRYQLELLRLLKEINQKYKITIIMVLHDINQAIQYSDHIIGMKQGQIIVEGKAKDIMNQEVIKKIYGIDLQTTIINDQTYVLTV